MEIRDILEHNDFSRVIEYPQATGRHLSRFECEDMVNSVIGAPVPNNNVKFIVHTADDKWFVIWYAKEQDKFLYEKLTAR